MTTTEFVTTDSSTTEPSKTTSTSSAPVANPTFNLLVNGGNLDGEVLKNDPTVNRLNSMLKPSDGNFLPVSVYIEEGTGRLRTLFADYYLCTAWGWTLTGDTMPGEVQLCNTWRITNGQARRLQYLTCQLTSNNGISCSVPGGICLIWNEGPRGTENRRCDFRPGTSFTRFSTSWVSALSAYNLYLGPDSLFTGYDTVEFKTRAIEQS
ncbi:hypothetical protein ACHAPT_012022 [Fusarium lateritium]